MSANRAHGVLNLDDFSDLFRDEEAYNQFTDALTEMLQHDLRPVVFGGRIIGATLSPEGARDVLVERLEKRVVQDPRILDELTRRISNEEIVE